MKLYFFKNVYVSENISNYLIGSVSAIDEDEDDTLTYSLTDFNYYSLYPGHRQSYKDFYTINSETGEVHIGSGGLDYEAFPLTYFPTHIYQPVWIKVEDGSGLGEEDVNRGFSLLCYQVFIIDENDNAPVFSVDSQTLSVNENEPSGTTIGTVSASDADIFAGDHTYSIETENVPFTIESSKRSGTIKTTSVLDYEMTNSYTLIVKVDDGFGTDTISVTINITNDTSDDLVPNTAPVFTEGGSTTRSIEENTPSGRNIGSAIAATDPDINDTLTYTLSGTDAASFSISSSNGQLQTSAALDYETKNTYEVTVTVQDGNGETDSIAVTINITNDTSDDLTTQEPDVVVTPTVPVSEEVQDDDTNNKPSFPDGDSTKRSIQENTVSGKNIGLPVSATDSDSSDSLTYTLSGTDAASFSINSLTGQLQTSAALDYETKNTYEVTVSVSDGNGGSNSITVTITVGDIDENPPTQQQVIVIPKSDSVPDPEHSNDTDTGEQNSQTGQQDDTDTNQQQAEVTTPQNTNQNTNTQTPQTDPQDDLQHPITEIDSQPEPNYTIIPFDYEKESVGKVVFSELMLAHLGKYPQWIELYNTTDQDIDMIGWKSVGRYLDDSNVVNIYDSQVISKSFIIKGKETGLIVIPFK